ncbi:Tetracenomycin polyketide synthesis O-methyltransferase TcmP [Cytospora mali]|uniref:Tetracenomycin polyketide synthesis O-methyltransferase TcmP n=1 Tax=Cytospora mali TaxID=578113 RepID=A0A194W208_CYTMA|nr:Tetracenomycin polyketide synthesis O-methyltransferase TcmP [Valsa mali]
MDSPSQAPGRKLKPNLTGTQETLLAILHYRAIDAKSAKPILGDQYAARIVDQLDYDFSKLGGRPAKAAALSIRAKFLDRWVAETLLQARQQREPVTVLHLAAGLDTRALRLQELCGGDGEEGLVRWVDVDLPEVVEVRQKLGLPAPEARRMQYELVGADVTAENWLAGLSLPRDRATFVVFEGLTMYLQPDQGRALVESLTGYFVSGRSQMAFDCFNWFSLLSQRLEPIVTKTGSRFLWAINEPRELEGWHQGLRLRDEVLVFDNPENVNLSAVIRWVFWVCSWIPALRTMGRYVRYEW